MSLHYKTKWLNCLRKLLFVVRIMQTKHTVGKLQYLNVETGGTYIYHCDLMVSMSGYCLYCMSGRVWQSSPGCGVCLAALQGHVGEQPVG